MESCKSRSTTLYRYDCLKLLYVVFCTSHKKKRNEHMKEIQTTKILDDRYFINSYPRQLKHFFMSDEVNILDNNKKVVVTENCEV